MSETTPEFDGKCALAVGLGPASKAPAGKAKHSLEIDGKTYYFAAGAAKALFKLIPGSLARAQKHWDAAQH